MKRRNFGLQEEEMRLSKILFNKSKNIKDKFSRPDDAELNLELKPAWIDEDDQTISLNTISKSKSNKLYSDNLKQKYETLMGTPTWAKLTKKTKFNDDNDEILRSVGHLQKKRKDNLPKDILEFKPLPKINSATKNEGPIISCVEFHPKMSVGLVAGKSGIISLFSIGGDVNNKLHSFKLKKWSITSAQFTQDGTEAIIASKFSHDYCIYNLVKAEPKLVELPSAMKKPTIFVMSSDGKYIAASDGFDEIYLICTASKELLRVLKHNANVQSVAFNHKCDELYGFTVQGDISVWDLSTYRVKKKFADHGCVSASCITTSQCGRLLAAGSGEGIVNIYDTSTLTTTNPVPEKVISNLRTKITKLKFNATSEILAASSSFYPNSVKLIHLPSYHVFSNFPNQQLNLHQVETINFSPNSGYMAIGNNKSNALLYRLKYYKNY